MKKLIFTFLFLPFLAHAQAEIGLSPQIESLIEQMGGKGMIYGKYVGIASSTPPQFLAFEKFVEKASLEDMISCLDHKDPSIRAYAFWGISLNHPATATKLAKEMGEDKANLNLMLGGCLVYPATVGSFRRDILMDPHPELFTKGDKFIQDFKQ